MFNTTYELSLNRNYVSHWGLLEAVRELIQNAIDSESPFNYEFVEHDDNEYSLILRSEFTTLSPQTLLLGTTSKSDSNDSIGSFGEGYKIALLVLTRLGNSVHIANGDKHWLPDFKYSNKFEQDLLVVYESSLPYKHTGLTFEIGGLDETEVSVIKDSCLQMQRDIGEIKQTKYGDILVDRKGKLYVGGLFICKTELDYGYNIKPEYIKLERDRQTVNSYDLNAITKNMWFQTNEFNIIAEMIEKDIPDVSYARFDSNEMVRNACYELFKKKHTHAVIAKSQDELKSLVAVGMTRVVVHNESFYNNVSESKEYKNEKKIIVKSVQTIMERWLDENKYHIHHTAKKSFQNLIEQSVNWRHK